MPAGRPPKNITLVNDKILDIFEKMEPRHVALLIAKILNPESRMQDLSLQLWPDLGVHRRNELIAQSQVGKVFPMVRDRPWVLAAIMAHKIAPLAMATLYELMMAAQKENVRVTAAKEVIRLAESTFPRMAPSDEEPEPTAELDLLLQSAQARRIADELAEEETVVGEPEIDPDDILLNETN